MVSAEAGYLYVSLSIYPSICMFIYPSVYISVYLSICIVCSVMSDSLQPHGLYSLPGSSVHGILQARILEQIAISYSRKSFLPRNQTCVSCNGRQNLYHEPPRKYTFSIRCWHFNSLEILHNYLDLRVLLKYGKICAHLPHDNNLQKPITSCPFLKKHIFMRPPPASLRLLPPHLPCTGSWKYLLLLLLL